MSTTPTPPPLLPPVQKEAGPMPEPGFDFAALPALSVCEVDRFCDQCARNLRGEPVRREPRTALLVICCSVCGRYQIANELAAATSRWTRRQAQGMAAGLIMVSLILFSIFNGVYAGLLTATLEAARGAVWFRNFEFTAPVIATGLISYILVFLTTLAMPHWHRWGYYFLAAAWPVLVTGLISYNYVARDYRPIAFDTAVEIVLLLHTVIFLGGATAAFTGRMLARWIALVVLAPPLRGYVSYLWTADGKMPPTTTPD